MADSNNINFVFNSDQQQDNIGYNYNTIHEHEQIEEQEHVNDDDCYDDKEMASKEYLQEIELDYTPNIVRWIKCNYMKHMKGAQDTVLISGYNYCNEYYLQTINYGKTNNEQNIEVICDNKIELKSEIVDIQFADDQTAVIATRTGEIKLIKLHENDEYNNNNNNDNDDEKMIVLNNNNNNNNNKWKLEAISCNNPIICYPNPFSKLCSASLTSLAVNTIRGNIIASDEEGYIYVIRDIDQSNSINILSQSCCSSSAINCIRFANSDEIVSVSQSGQLMLWDLRSLNKICYTSTIPRKYGSLISLAVHPNRNHIYATGNEYGSIVIWDIRGNNNNNNNNNNNDAYKIFSGHCKHTLVNDINFLTNNSNSMNGLVTCGNDGITQIFQSKYDEWKDLTQSVWNTNITAIQEEKYPITSLDFYEPLSVIATCSDAQKLSFFPII